MLRDREQALHSSALAESFGLPVLDAPIYEPLGYEVPRCGQALYYFRIAGMVRCYRAWELQSLPFLIEMHPDISHWREMFPGIRRGRVDTLQAAAHFTRLCMDRGLYAPLCTGFQHNSAK